MKRMFGCKTAAARSLFAATSLAVAASAGTVWAQVGTDRVEGLRDNTPRWHAITGARLVLSPDRTIERGTLVMKDGVIVAVGADIPVPAGARVWMLVGRTVYAGFVDLNSNVGVPAVLRPLPAAAPAAPGAGRTATGETRPLAARAMGAKNRVVRPDLEIAPQLEIKADEIKAARELGFTTVLAAPATGILRGQSALLNLADLPNTAHVGSMVLMPRAAQHLSTEIERSGENAYPNSVMGAIALIRQTLYDARWYRGVNEFPRPAGSTAERPQTNASLEALAPLLAGRQPAIFQADGEQDFQRASRIRDEFSLRMIAKGNGLEYRRAAQLKSLKMPVIVPLNFPAVPEIENPDSAIDVPLEALQHWERAPSNLAELQKAGIEFAITASGLREGPREFWPNLRLAVKRGLPARDALAALTTVPAKLIGANQVGTLEPGRLANLVVANGNLFEIDTAEIELSFVDGQPYTTAAYDRFDARGKWSVTASGKSVDWDIGGTRVRPQLRIDGATCDVTVRGRQLVVNLPCGRNTGERETVVADYFADALRGTSQQGGRSSVWSAKRTAAFSDTRAGAEVRKDVPPPPLANRYPAGPFSVPPTTRPAALLVRNATIWTSAAAGNLQQTDLLVRDGRIAAIGNALAAPEGAVVIDAMGKHVTPGIIDAHSHTAVSGGINESTSSITAEVRVGDVIDATDVNIYRELAGGLTAANVLHGSANTIGGQNQVIKLRWGADADALKFAGAIPGIKFALGENVKQANWPGTNTRYPQTRMGVEQVLRDAFEAAKQYQQTWAAWRAAPKSGPEPRRDLQLDTLVEILDKKRVIHIHSYRADEIFMFVKIAREFGFKVATFQHVLEGYKVAEAIASIGAGGSTFSDWWGYKMEVFDAIPYNGAIMHRAGVLTTFNSDSDELARRLNTEAAKAVKYGGMSETEALKFVTINAAKQLKVDSRTGSLEVGKDADFVIWTAHPLSTEARAEQTWIDGQRYFDLAADAQLREEAQAERERLTAKALPLRMERLARASAAAAAAAAGGARPEGAADATPRTPTMELLDYLAFQNWLHKSRQFRDAYWSGGHWHECTEDGQ
jgi:imidazolonepropionase-like amidohydrolase